MFRKAILLFCLANALLYGAAAVAQQEQDVEAEQSQNYSEYDDTVSYDEELDDYENYDDYDNYDGGDDRQVKENFTLESGESLPRSENSKRYHSEIEKILAGADFAQREKVTRRRLKDVTDKETREEKFPQWIIDLVKSIESADGGLAVFAKILELLVWSLVIGVILFLFIKYRTQLKSWASNIRTKELEPELPTSLFGLDIQKESIPDDVVSTSEGHWLKGEKREAVAVLLRSSLIKLLHEHNCRFFSSDTEAECCDRIDQQATESISVYMRELVAVWQRIAYAHVDPSQGEYEHLCLRWREVFQ